MLRKNGEYAAAIPYYENYLAYAQTLPAGKERKDSLTQIGLTSCRLAQEWKKKPTRYIVKRVPILVSRRSDYSPMYAGDDPDILYFTSTRNEAKGTDLNGITGMKSADIFHSKRNEKKQWQKPEPLASEVNSEFEEGACSFHRMVKQCILLAAGPCPMHQLMPRFMFLSVPEQSGELLRNVQF